MKGPAGTTDALLTPKPLPGEEKCLASRTLDIYQQINCPVSLWTAFKTSSFLQNPAHCHSGRGRDHRVRRHTPNWYPSLLLLCLLTETLITAVLFHVGVTGF